MALTGDGRLEDQPGSSLTQHPTTLCQCVSGIGLNKTVPYILLSSNLL